MSFIHGKILISAEAESFSVGTAYIYLENTSCADAPAEVLAKTSIKNIKHDPGQLKQQTVIPFHLNFDEKLINFKNIYSLRVWIDTDGSGKQSLNDLYSDEFYPVLTRGSGDYAEIRV